MPKMFLKQLIYYVSKRDKINKFHIFLTNLSRIFRLLRPKKIEIAKNLVVRVASCNQFEKHNCILIIQNTFKYTSGVKSKFSHEILYWKMFWCHSRDMILLKDKFEVSRAKFGIPNNINWYSLTFLIRQQKFDL